MADNTTDKATQETRKAGNPLAISIPTALLLTTDNARREYGDGIPRSANDPESFESLCDSIKARGILQYPKVRAATEEDVAAGIARTTAYWIVLIGNRRVRAAKYLGIENVTCSIGSADELWEQQWAENRFRKGFDCVEAANKIADLYDGGKGVTQSKLSKRLGCTQPYISEYIQIAELMQRVPDLETLYYKLPSPQRPTRATLLELARGPIENAQQFAATGGVSTEPEADPNAPATPKPRQPRSPEAPPTPGVVSAKLVSIIVSLTSPIPDDASEELKAELDAFRANDGPVQRATLEWVLGPAAAQKARAKAEEQIKAAAEKATKDAKVNGEAAAFEASRAG